MKYLLTLLLILGVFLLVADAAYAQTCVGGPVTCGSSETRVCRNQITGQVCSPGSPDCQCNYECTGGTWTCNSCADAPSAGGCRADYACLSVNSCICVKSGACWWSAPPDPDPDPDPEPDPSSPPGWGACGSCSVCGPGNNAPPGECVLDPNNICQWDPSGCGGGDGALCRVEFPDGISTVTAGQTVQLSAFSRGGNWEWDGVWTWANNSPNLGSFNPYWSGTGTPVNSAVYPTSFTATTPGSSLIWFRVVGDNNLNDLKCEGTRRIWVTTPTPWAQILNGDLMTFGRISMTIPSGQFLVAREGSDEGIITHTTTNVPTAQVSQRGWNVSNSPLSRPLRYADLFEQVPLTPRQINGAINTSSLNPSPAQPDAFGYEWFLYSGNNAIIPNGLTISSGRKVVLFVPGDVAINGNITINDMSNSFFMLVSSGNITVNNPVGRNASETAPSLDGIYVSDGVFGTSRSVGANNNRVNVRGTVVALGGVNLQRDTQTAFPSETFSFAPELILNFPPSLSTKRAFWKEITP